MSGSLAGDQVLQAQLAKGGQHRFDVAVRFGRHRAEGLGGGDKGFTLEGTADDVDEAFGQVREIAEGAMLDLMAFAVGVAE